MRKLVCLLIDKKRYIPFLPASVLFIHNTCDYFEKYQLETFGSGPFQ